MTEERSCRVSRGPPGSPRSFSWTISKWRLPITANGSASSCFTALSPGGGSWFNALLGGGRAPDGREYSRLDAHAFYWTALERVRPLHGSTTSVRASCLSVAMMMARSSGRFSVRCLRD